MSMFTKDFLKDSLIPNDDQDSAFGSDSHQNGFGLSGYGAHSLGQVQQQRAGMPGNPLVQQQQSLYPGRTGPIGLNMASQQDLLNANRSNSAFGGPQIPQGIIGGNVGGNFGGLQANLRPVGVGEIGAGNGRIPSANDPNTTLNSLNRFGPSNSGFNPLTGPTIRGNDEDFLSNQEADDFPALPGQLGKHDHPLGGMLGGGSSLLGDKFSDGSLTPNQSIPGASPLFPSPANLQAPPALGLGSSLLGNARAHPFPPGNPNALPGSIGPIESGNVSSNSSLSGVTTASLGTQGGGAGLLGNLGLAGLTGQSTATQSLASQATSTALSKEARFGMAGLVENIRFTEKDMHVLALGTDLTTFGLNLNAADNLYTSFLSPFTDGSQSDEPQFKTPQCYLMSHPPVLKADHWSKLQPETLFYIFYQMPKDILQACAAQELYRRDWRYHAELKIWLKPHRQPNDIIQPQTLQFLYFDAKSWEQKILNASQIRGNLLAGLIPEEEIRVKVPMPGQNPIVEPS